MKLLLREITFRFSIFRNKQKITREYFSNLHSYDGCVPSLNLKVFGDNRYKCNKFFSAVLDQIKDRNIKKVFLFSRWSFNLIGVYR